MIDFFKLNVSLILDKMEKCERIRRMKLCVAEKLDLRLILDEYSWLILNEIAVTTNVAIDYIFLTTIIALCHWTMGASLKGAQSYNTPLILFGILCGGSGMFKSSEIDENEIMGTSSIGDY